MLAAAMALILLTAAAVVSTVSAFGGGKSTIFVACTSDTTPTSASKLAGAVRAALPLDPPVEVDGCNFADLQLQSYKTIVVSMNGGSPGSTDIKALGDL